MVIKGQNIDHVVIECPLLPHNIKRKAFVSFYMRHFSFFVLLFCQETRDVQKKKSFYVLHCQTSRRRSRHTQGDLTQMFPTIPNPIHSKFRLCVMVANSANSGEFYTISTIIWHPWQPWIRLHLEVQMQIYYRICRCGKNLSQISLCAYDK